MKRGTLADLLGLNRREPETLPGTKSVHLDPSDMTLHVTGYTGGEVAEIFTAYRDHLIEMIPVMRAMADSNAELSGASDAVRYTPDESVRPMTFGPEDIMGEGDAGT